MIFLFSTFLLISSLCQGADGTLIDKPADATLRPGCSLRLNCSSDITGTPVEWRFTKEGSTVKQQVTAGGAVAENFMNLFKIDAYSKYDLIATNTNDVEPYSGTYECQDNNGVGETASATVSTVTLPSCAVNRQSATGSQKVIFACSVAVCGTASIPVNIAQSGVTVKSGRNTVTWETTADDLSGTDVKCSADFGDPVNCPSVYTQGSASGSSTTTIIIIVIVICVVLIILICICFIIIFVTRREREREEPYPAMVDNNARVNAQSIDVVRSRNGRYCYPNCRDEIPAWSREKEYIPRHYPRGGNGYPYYVQPRIYSYHVPANKRHYPSWYVATAT